MWFEPPRLFRKLWPKDNMVHPVLSFSRVLTKSQYGSTDIAFSEYFNQKKRWFNRNGLFRKFWPKYNIVEPILSFSNFITKGQYGSANIIFLEKVLIERKYRSTHIFFFKSFYQKTIWFKPYSLLKKFGAKDNMVQPIVFEEIFDLKTIWLNQYSLFKKLWTKDNMVQPI